MTDDASPPWAILTRGTGRWEGAETMAPAPWAPDGMVSTGTSVARSILDGRGLAADYVQRVGGQATLHSHTVLHWDATSDEFVMHFFSGGEPMVLRGRREGDAVVLDGDGPGGPMRQTTRYGADELKVVSEGRDPETGEWATTFEGTYRRVGDAAPF